MAKISQGTMIVSGAAVVFTLIAIAFERYFAIVHPLKARARTKSRPTIWPLAVIWICSIVFALPFFIAITTRVTQHYVKENGQVTLQDITFIDIDFDVHKFRIYYVIVFLGLHVLPFVSLVTMYTRIAWKLWHPDRRLTEQPEGAGGNETVSRVSERNRRRTTKMVIVVLIAFFVCFFPFHVYFITQVFSDSYENKPTKIGSVLKLLLVLNAAVNPIVYNLLSEKFRGAFRSMLACCPRATPEMATASLNRTQSSGN
ncbi:tachykinin-like peptides receptor 99D isoform X1 [Paramuricea clavata]|nr:tachykinin-like peptides receptor 99D isoform X1 [Paramuricea clavata]